MLASAMVEDSSFEDDQLTSMSTDDIVRAPKLLDNENRILKEDMQRTNRELDSFKDKIKEHQEKIKLNKQWLCKKIGPAIAETVSKGYQLLDGSRSLVVARNCLKLPFSL